jgi:hypothetical protein
MKLKCLVYALDAKIVAFQIKLGTKFHLRRQFL